VGRLRRRPTCRLLPGYSARRVESRAAPRLLKSLPALAAAVGDSGEIVWTSPNAGGADHGGTARATFLWTPSTPGDFRIQFAASDADLAAATRTYVVHVTPAVQFPRSYLLSGDRIARWATVWERGSRPLGAKDVDAGNDDARPLTNFSDPFYGPVAFRERR
jgi:hypothetical protein